MHQHSSNDTQRFAAVLEEVKREHAALKAQWSEITAELGGLRSPGPEGLERLIESLPLHERRALRRFHDETAAMTRDATPTKPASKLPLPRFFANALRA